MADTSGSGAETRYKIGEVCRIADVQPYVLRYWESEFPVLAPDKSSPGPRTYSGRELKLIERIKRLLYDEGYTIAGAKKRLESEGSGKQETRDGGADTNPAVAPVADAPKPAKADRAEKADRPEKAAASDKGDRGARAARSARPAPPKFTEAIEFELPAPEITQPVAATGKTGDDDRIERAVADLKEVLALLARSEP